MSPICPPRGRSLPRRKPTLGPIDILFNNAGMNIRKPFEDYTEAEFDRIFAVHVRAMFFMAQAVYPPMCARGSGCIINVASQQALTGSAGAVPYSAAKAAILGFTRALAREAAPRGVRVNAIAPGPIDTDLVRQNTPEWQDCLQGTAAGGAVRHGRGDRAQPLCCSPDRTGASCRGVPLAQRGRRDALRSKPPCRHPRCRRSSP